MTNAAGTVKNGLVLRMSAPVSGEIAAIASEMIVKLAEQAGVAPGQSAGAGEALAILGRQVDPSGGADIDFEFHKSDTELTIEARHDGRAAETRIPISA